MTIDNNSKEKEEQQGKQINPSKEGGGGTNRLLPSTIEKRKVLIVDDEPDITLTLRIGLEDNGFEVYTFNNPIEALSNFKAGYL